MTPFMLAVPVIIRTQTLTPIPIPKTMGNLLTNKQPWLFPARPLMVLLMPLVFFEPKKTWLKHFVAIDLLPIFVPLAFPL